MRLPTIALSAALLLTLPGCSGGGDEDPGASPTAGGSAVFDEQEVIDYLGLAVRPEDDYPGEFEISTSMFADYRWESDGEVCFISDVTTSAEESASADVTNPDKTAGVSFYADMPNRSTCSTLLADALADFPQQ